jgi:uncharacterized caspase-like protein/TPR repeat protein
LFLRLLAFLALVFAATAAMAESRVALVIGNGAYRNTTALPNPVNDAADVGKMLGGLGFDVTTALDLDGPAFDQTLSEFSRKVEDADVAVFFYAGHGLQFDNENYLVPIDAKLQNEFSVQRETTSLRQVMALMESARISLIFLDACRNNPLAEDLARSMRQLGRSVALGRGLAPPPATGRDVLIAFAAAPDQVAFDGEGRNSPFTGAILRHLPTPDIEISTALKRVTQAVREATGGQQLPQQLSDIATELYLARGIAVEQAPLAVTPVPAIDPEEEAFRIAAGANTAASWSAFLEAFPEGRYAPVARVSLAALLPAIATPEPQPAEESATGEQSLEQELLEGIEATKEVQVWRADIAAIESDLARAESDGNRVRMDALTKERALIENRIRKFSVATSIVDRYGLADAGPLQVEAIFEGTIAKGDARGAFEYGVLLDGWPVLGLDPVRAAENFLRALELGDATMDEQVLERLEGISSLLEENTRIEIQARLAKAGVYDGEAHGTFNNATRRALAAYASLGTVAEQSAAASTPAPAIATGLPEAAASVKSPDLEAMAQQIATAEKAGDTGGASKLKVAYATLGRKLGDADLIANLALYYATGQGVDRDPTFALTLFDEARNAKSGIASYNFGWMVDKGEGFTQHSQRAANLMLRGIELATPETRRLLVDHLMRDAALLKTETRTFLEAGLVDAGFYAGEPDGNIDNATRNALEGFAGLKSDEASLSSVSPTGAQLFADFKTEWDAGNYDNALKLLDASAQEKNARAMGQLATFYSTGTLVDRNIPLAVSLYEGAITGGDYASMFALAQLNDKGGEIAYDSVRAADLFLRGLQAAPDDVARAHLNDLVRLGDAYFTRESRQYLQHFLAERSDFRGAADGVIGPATQRALDSYVVN